MPQLQPQKQFPPVPEFYGGELGPQVTNETASNQADWSTQYRQSVPPTKPLFDVLMDLANDPRNAWLGLGPMAGAVKGARLIKPLVAAEQPLNKTIPATRKALKWSGSEATAKILDYDPQLNRTTNPVWGGPFQTADSFTQMLPGGPPVTPDEITAAQDILKKLAQQGAPETMTLYRGGEPLKHSQWTKMTSPPNPNTPIPATSNLNTATEFAAPNLDSFHPAPLFELKVPRADLLANIEKLQRGRGYKENEYLVPLRAFQGAQTRLPFENPPRTMQFKGAQRSRG